LPSLSIRLQIRPDGKRTIDLTAETRELLERVNHSVNMSIFPRSKSYGPNLEVAPETGDCNDYAVTKRHDLLENGLPSRALRLSTVKTASGIGHLVLVVVTTKGDLVLDDLTETIRPWQSTNYHWLKIQSATDTKRSGTRSSGPRRSARPCQKRIEGFVFRIDNRFGRIRQNPEAIAYSFEAWGPICRWVPRLKGHSLCAPPRLVAFHGDCDSLVGFG
jgi:hypothetical protein